MTNRSRRSYPLVATGLLLACVVVTHGRSAVAAPDPPHPQPGAVIRDVVDRVFAVLRDPTLQGQTERAERMRRIRHIVDEVFDWESMARSSLGVHWRTLGPEQRRAFVDQFKETLARRYRDDIDRFRGTERVTVGTARVDGERAEVHSILVTHGREIVPIDYHLERAAGKWWIHDVSVEGVSTVNHYRGSFRRFLVNHSFDALLRRLGEQNAM